MKEEIRKLFPLDFYVNDKGEMVAEISINTLNKLSAEIIKLEKNQRYYKNGVFSLEYDKETMSDMIDEYKSRIDKALNILKSTDNMYDYEIIERVIDILEK